jgi:hypothetical protein
VGKPEHANGPARVYDNEGRWMPDYWQDLVSVIAWVGRPNTKFSEAMLLEMHAYLDGKLSALKKHPGKHPREKKIQSRTILGQQAKKVYHWLLGRDIHYPIPWTLFGNLFHPLNLTFKNHVRRNLPQDAIKNAGIYHRKK